MDQLHDLYANPRIANVFFIGAKYAVTPQIDVAAAYYYLGTEQLQLLDHALRIRQRQLRPPERPFVLRFHASTAAPAPARRTPISFLIDYRPVKRVDLYAGVMVSNVYGGLANGFAVTQEIAPTAGLRIKF